MREFRGRTASVTGGASGIGLGMAQAFAKRGMNVVIADLLEAHLDEARELLRGTNRIHCIRLDVSTVQRWRRRRGRRSSSSATSTSCATMSASASANRSTRRAADWDYVLDVNLGGTIAGIVEFVPGMKAHG
jgi:NAD(P)-dependent dehydrogenase (short-subunit alcohol dehydrogenase family)